MPYFSPPSGMVLLDSKAATGSLVTFNNISKNFLMIRFRNVGRTIASQTSYALSPDGSTWSSATVFGASYTSNCNMIPFIFSMGDAGFFISNRNAYTINTGNQINPIGNDGDSFQWAQWRLTAKLNSIRFGADGSSFNSGTIEIWGM